jgi:Co/Zn/Cd efflux system component
LKPGKVRFEFTGEVWSYLNPNAVYFVSLPPDMSADIRKTLEGELGARVADLHLWRLGPGHHGLIVSLVSPGATSAETIKTALRRRHPDLSHVTVEVAVCADCT